MRDDNEFIYKRLVQINELKHSLADTKAWLDIAIYICIIEGILICGLVFCLVFK